MFPGSIPSYAGFTGSHTLSTDNHAAQHNAEQADISALATKIGTGASTPASGLVLRSSGAGVSAWGQVNLATDVTGNLNLVNNTTGILPISKGGTGGDFSAVSAGTVQAPGGNLPLVVTSQPTISDFTNANHTHASSSQGGQLGASSIAIGTSLADRLKNPYKFSAYMNASLGLTSTTWTKAQLDTEVFDTGNNFDSATNYRFTAPIAGFYVFLAQIALSDAGVTNLVAMEGALYKNGSVIVDGTRQSGTGTGSSRARVTIATLLQLAQGDYIELYGIIEEGGRSMAGGQTLTYLTGFLMSAT